MVAEKTKIPNKIVGFLNKINDCMSPILKEHQPAAEGDKPSAKAVGAALRQLQGELQNLDPSKNWGGLQAVATKDGEIRYVCEEHVKHYHLHQHK